MKKKLLSAALAATMAFSMSAFTGCSMFQDEGGEEYSSDISHLFVGVYDGGFAAESWEELGRRFEEIYKNESFEAGKTGVKVHIIGKKEEYLSEGLRNKMGSNQEDMYFTNANVYDFASDGSVIDVSDVVNNTLDAKYSKVYGADFGDTTTIADKFANDEIKKFTLQMNPDYKNSNKFYGIPVFVSTSSMIYDVDLWEGIDVTTGEATGEPLYFTRSFELDSNAAIKWTNGLEGSEEKSWGQDGVQGTLDDGLPVKFSDFQLLIDRIRSMGIIPLTYSGANPGYVREYCNQFYANYEGYDDFVLNVTYGETTNPDGSINTTGVTDSDGNLITPKTGYNVFKQSGRRAVISFCNWLASDDANFDKTNCFNNGTHTGTQSDYVLSRTQPNRIAMLIEGNWWEREANSAIVQLDDSYSIKNPRFGIMTFPIMDAGDARNSADAQKITYSIQPYSYAFISSYSKEPIQEIAKLFLAFTTNNQSLAYYTSYSGAPRPFKYNIDEEGEDYARMSYYKKSVWENYKGIVDGTANLVYDRGTCAISQFASPTLLGKLGFETDTISNPLKAFKDDKNLTVDSYFNWFFDTYQGVWDSAYYSLWTQHNT